MIKKAARRGVRGRRAAARCSTSRSSSRRCALDDEYFIVAQALPERRLLLGPDLRGAGPAGRDVPGHVRDRPRTRGWIAQWLEMIAGLRAEDRAPAPDLHGRARADVRPGRRAAEPRAIGGFGVTVRIGPRHRSSASEFETSTPRSTSSSRAAAAGSGSPSKRPTSRRATFFAAAVVRWARSPLEEIWARAAGSKRRRDRRARGRDGAAYVGRHASAHGRGQGARTRMPYAALRKAPRAVT